MITGLPCFEKPIPCPVLAWKWLRDVLIKLCIFIKTSEVQFSANAVLPTDLNYYVSKHPNGFLSNQGTLFIIHLPFAILQSV